MHTYVLVLVDHPGLEGGVEDGGGDAAQQPTHHQDVEVRGVLRRAGQHVPDIWGNGAKVTNGIKEE